MKVGFYNLFFMALLVFNCGPRDPKFAAESKSAIKSNMTQDMIAELHWVNQPESFIIENNSLKISVSKGTDFFNNPEDSSIIGSAPYLYKEIAGDFVVKALVQPDFSDQWNAVAIMLHIDSLNWIKFAYENSDATGPSIVSVVTKGNSDDANGAVLSEEPMIWLMMVRKGNIYAMHWSVDGKNFKMARLTSMLDHKVIKIGIEAQSPVGERATHRVHYFELIEETVANLRDINAS